MNEAERTPNFPVMIVYWFLAGMGWLFALGALWQVNIVRTRPPLQVRVSDRTVQVEVREVSGKRGKYKALFAVAQLRLERLDTRAAVTQTDERRITNEELVSLSFLDRWERGATLPAVEQNGALELDPDSPWLAAMGFGILAFMMGAFAWITKPFAEGGNTVGMGKKMLVLGLFPLGAMVFGIGSNVLKDKEEMALQRTGVEGKGKSTPTGEFLSGLSGLGVKAGEDVRTFLSSDDVQFCEFQWEGKTWLAVSSWCRTQDGEVTKGRLNPGNPRDVKWGEEP